MLAPVRRPLIPAFVAVDAVAVRIMEGAILHDPAGCYTVGEVHGYQTGAGAYALYAWTDRADHSRERVWTNAIPEVEPRYTLAARAFVSAIGAEAAMAACQQADNRL